MSNITKIVLLAIKMILQKNWFTSFCSYQADSFNPSKSNFKVLIGIVWELENCF